MLLHSCDGLGKHTFNGVKPVIPSLTGHCSGQFLKRPTHVTMLQKLTVWVSEIEVMRMNCEVPGQFIANLHVANLHVLFIGEAADGVLAVS